MNNDFTHLWNDLPFEERKRLMPYMVQSQKTHILQCKERAVRAHKKHMAEINDLIKNLDRELDKIQIKGKKALHQGVVRFNI